MSLLRSLPGAYLLNQEAGGIRQQAAFLNWTIW